MGAERRYEPCSRCVEARASGDVESALRCRSCSGNGFIRTIESYACNQCGGPLSTRYSAKDGDLSPYGLVEQVVMGHYHSDQLSDTITYRFSLCEGCLRQLFNGFRVPPQVGEYSLGDGAPMSSALTYAEEREAYEYRTWRLSPHYIAKREAGLCNATIACEQRAALRHFCSDHLTEDVSCHEHRRKHLSANTWQVPVEWIANDGDLEQVARAFLRISTRRIGDVEHVTFHRFVADCVWDLMLADDNDPRRGQDGTSMLWVPTSASVRMHRDGTAAVMHRSVVDVPTLFTQAFAEGSLYVAESRWLQPVSVLPGVLQVNVLPNHYSSNPPGAADDAD